jgi:hypothetical protein
MLVMVFLFSFLSGTSIEEVEWVALTDVNG